MNTLKYLLANPTILLCKRGLSCYKAWSTCKALANASSLEMHYCEKGLFQLILSLSSLLLLNDTPISKTRKVGVDHFREASWLWYVPAMLQMDIYSKGLPLSLRYVPAILQKDIYSKGLPLSLWYVPTILQWTFIHRVYCSAIVVCSHNLANWTLIQRVYLCHCGMFLQSCSGHLFIWFGLLLCHCGMFLQSCKTTFIPRIYLCHY